jgi:hypothetical protein
LESVKERRYFYTAPALFAVNDSLVISNLSEIGISLGDNEACVSGSLATIKEKVVGRRKENSHVMLTERVPEKEKKELLEEELDKLFLKNICSKIMDEVMDLGGDCDVMLSESHNRKKGSKKGKRLFRPKK